jgi:predicted ArsR family transcriptional regulator
MKSCKLSDVARFDAVGNPTKLRLVRHLEGEGAASLQELADAASIHLNTARQHIAELEGDGVVERVAGTPAGRGRPVLRYRIVPGWTAPAGDFRGLAQVLATALTRRGATTDELRDVAFEWGRQLPAGRAVEQELRLALEQLGFSAQIDDGTLELTDCPCPCMLPDQPAVICGAAMAVTEGVLAGSGSGLRITGSIHDPDRRSCSARLQTEVPA